MKHWLRIFLPLWALGTVAWITTGFILVPDSFRKPLLYSPGGVWVGSTFQTTEVDMQVARALAVVVGPPVLAFIIAIAIVILEKVTSRFGRRRA